VPAMRGVVKFVLARRSVPILLLLAGVAGVVSAFAANSVTWKAVWIGVASSCLTGGLVDGSALLEVRRRDRAILRIAGLRVGYLHQRLLWIIGAVFDVSGEPLEVGSALRDLHRARIDLTAIMPAVVPARTRLARAMESLAQMEEALAVAVSLGVQTTEAGRFEQLDASLRSNHFYAWLKSAPVTPSILDEDSALASAAADALDAAHKQFRFFAGLRGENWRHGQPPSLNQPSARVLRSARTDRSAAPN